MCASPGARLLASEEGLDLTTVEESGPHGVVTEDDVRRHLDETTAVAGDVDVSLTVDPDG